MFFVLQKVRLPIQSDFLCFGAKQRKISRFCLYTGKSLKKPYKASRTFYDFFFEAEATLGRTVIRTLEAP